jgi:CubicO group peptidase (beta-lactamase class C family)
MQKHVFDPLKMHNSSLLLDPKIKQHLITVYDRDGKQPIKYWHNIYRPFAAINTNNQDMIQWLQMLLKQNNEFLNQTERQRLVQPNTTLAAQHGLTFGYGLGVYQWQTNGHSFFGHGGDADGYLTRFGYNSESGLAYFVMINAFNHKPLNQIVDLLEQQITSELSQPKYPKRLPPSEKQVNQLIGSYQSVTTRFGENLKPLKTELKVFVTDNQLFYQHRNSRAQAIYLVKGGLFRTADDAVATMAFIERQGNMYFQSPLGNFVQINKQDATEE